MMLGEKPCPLGRRETRKQDRRDAILAAAKRSFMEEGYAATSMSGLLKTLGGSKATLWSYFRSKEELFAAVIEDLTEDFRGQLEEELLTPGDIRSVLVTFCRSFMAKMTRPDSVSTWRLVVAESGRFPEVGRIFYEQAASHVEHALTRYITQQVAAGTLRDENPASMAQFLLAMCAMRQNKRLWGIAGTDAAEIERDAEMFVTYFERSFMREAEDQ